MSDLSRFEVHSHTWYSNIRLLDSINSPKKLIDRAIALNLAGIAITDHEALCSHVEVNMYAKKIREQHPDFKVALGNEIYLTGSREKSQRYYHFILIAKNKTGYRALRELSSYSWMNSYFDRGLERVPTLYNELEDIVKKYPNSLIATTACLGGELSTWTKTLIEAEDMGDAQTKEEAHNHIVNFILWCVDLFGDDFYIECAPACSKDQIKVNKRLMSIAAAFNIPMVIGTDAHYLKQSDRYVHKAYLTSSEGDREVDDFYAYSYLQDENEIFENLRRSNYSDSFIKDLFNNSLHIYNKIENYSIEHKQVIPRVAVDNYDKWYDYGFYSKYPILGSLLNSDDMYERYWVNECLIALKAKEDANEIDAAMHDIYVRRLEEEADIKKTISEKLETNMFNYPITLRYYINMIWECGSTVGAGRGSSCSGLNHYLLGITQLDPIKWELPFWRYLNKERIELGDIDIDICPSRRPAILNKIKAERGSHFNSDVNDLSRKNLGCTLVATFGTETTKSAILTSCRGYRSEEYPEGIDNDIAQYLSSLVPVERGFVWTVDELVNGNPEKDRKPVRPFITEVEKYPGLLEIIQGVEGIINKRSSHASGVIFFDEDPYEFGCFMRTPNGEIITQYDLHMAEAVGMTKYDFLVTEVQDKIVQTINLMQKYGEMEKELSLKEAYNKYLHPSVIDQNFKSAWEALRNNSVINIFQFDSEVGSQAAKKIKPQNMLEMADANGLMRLMASEKGELTPMEKYILYKNNIKLWYEEMKKKYDLTDKEIETVKPYFEKSYGVPPSQEQLMQMLMDENICHFNLAEANAARKIVGKKQMSKIPELKQKVLDQAASPELGKYIWECGIGPQMGYSFSIIHALAYSFIGYQTIYLATKWDPIYWDCACLIVNSGSLEDNSKTEIVDIYEPEHQELIEGTTFVDLPDRSGKIKKTASADYAKIAKAIGEIIGHGIKMSLIDINKSGYSFEPNLETQEILYGLKPLSGLNNDVIDVIIKNRPYNTIYDFIQKCHFDKRVMLSLIKGGAFDNLDYSWCGELSKTIHPRVLAMGLYLSTTADLKSKLTLSNMPTLIKKKLVPNKLSFQVQVYNFNKYLKKNCKAGDYYLFDYDCEEFYDNNFDMEHIELINGKQRILQKVWDKIYDNQMNEVRDWIKSNSTQILYDLNKCLFEEEWASYAQGSLSAWEMDSLCFYYHEHELKDVDTEYYGIVDFNSLSPDSAVDYYFKRNGKEIPIYQTSKIIGTVISKDDTRSSVTILTTTGVVNVKFTKEYYAKYNRQISEVQEDGTKKVKEKGWFARGSKILVTGYRRDDTFVAKTYKNTPTHQLYKITDINKDEIILTHSRWGEEDE